MRLTQTMLTLSFVLSGSTALASVCPIPTELPKLTTADSRDFLKNNRIKASSALSDRHLQEFYVEFHKFPLSLRAEMIAMESDIHILEGTGVTEDPSWDPNDVTSGAGRSWSQTPGSGGFPFKKFEDQKYLDSVQDYNRTLTRNCRKNPNCDPAKLELIAVPGQKSYPTRIVINQLYNFANPVGGHGSVNLFLHEHGHSLDSLYASHDISEAPAFRKLFELPANLQYLRRACSSHCGTGATVAYIEAFAELFAQYHACGESRRTMEADAPEIAKFFANLNSIKEFKRKEGRTKGLDLIPSRSPEKRPHRRGLFGIVSDIF